jgi:hypothetical protein
MDEGAPQSPLFLSGILRLDEIATNVCDSLRELLKRRLREQIAHRALKDASMLEVLQFRVLLSTSQV